MKRKGLQEKDRYDDVITDRDRASREERRRNERRQKVTQRTPQDDDKNIARH